MNVSSVVRVHEKMVFSGNFNCSFGFCASLVLLVSCQLFHAGVINGASCDPGTEFTCSNRRCIPRANVNDSFNDCGDNSDESPSPCRAPMFSCSNKQCVLIEWVLNGRDDCNDKSDEVKVIGSRCGADHECCPCQDFVPHSKCYHDNGTSTCRCQHGFYGNRRGNKCLPRLIGTECQKDFDCSAVIPGSYCGYSAHSTASPDPLAAAAAAGVSSPRQYQCLCDAELVPSVDRRSCHGVPPHVDVAVLAFCVFLVGFLLLLDAFLVLWLLRAFVCTASGQRPVNSFTHLLAVLGRKRPATSRTPAEFDDADDSDLAP